MALQTLNWRYMILLFVAFCKIKIKENTLFTSSIYKGKMSWLKAKCSTLASFYEGRFMRWIKQYLAFLWINIWGLKKVVGNDSHVYHFHTTVYLSCNVSLISSHLHNVTHSSQTQYYVSMMLQQRTSFLPSVPVLWRYIERFHLP